MKNKKKKKQIYTKLGIFQNADETRLDHLRDKLSLLVIVVVVVVSFSCEKEG